MKKGWEYKKLGEVISHLRTGLNPRTHFKLNTPDAESYYITVRELKGFTIEPDEKTDKVNSAAIKRINERSNLKIGDVLFSGTGTIGKTALVCELPENWNIKEGVYAMTPKHSELDSKYFIYYISSEYFLRLVNDKAAGTGVRSIPMKELVKLPILIPPLSEQQSIVDYLDSAFAKIDAMKANAEKALNEAEALFQASLKEMLEPKEGWEEKKLMDIGELKNGMNFNKNESGYNVHILGVGDFGKLFLIDDTDCLQTISLNSNPSEEYILKNEDIVFVRSNGNKNLVGRCVLIHVGEEPCSFSGFCIRFRKSTNEVDACYLTHFLKTENARKKLVGNGANISNLNQKVLNEFVVSYPSISEQQSIVTTLDSLKSKVDRLQANYEKISQECDALKQAILRQVFE